MKKLFVGIAALFVLLAFTSCKQEPSTVTLVDVFYTDSNPDTTPYEDLPHVTSLKSGENYYLVCYYIQPDLNCAKLRMTYDSKDIDYRFSSLYDDDYVWWNGQSWTAGSSSHSINLTFSIIDNEGRSSNSKQVLINLHK